MKKYSYVGNGMGVPGLPHEVSDDEAAELGVLHILIEAIENGVYVEVPSDLVSIQGGKTPPLLDRQDSEREAKKKGVNNG